MADTPKKTEEAEATYALVTYLLLENGPLYSLRNGCTIADVSNFARDEHLIRNTSSFLSYVKKQWREHEKKHVLTYAFPKIEDDHARLIEAKTGGQVSPLHNHVTIKAETKNSAEQTVSKAPDNSNAKTAVRNNSTTMTPNNSSPKPGGIPQNAPPPVMPNPPISFGMRNAKVGEPYSDELQVQGETENKKIVIQEVVFPEGVGLSALDTDFRKITGSPLKDGDHKVLVHYQFQNARPEHPSLRGEFNLFINPDPKSLWKKIDPDPNDPYFKKNEDKNLKQGNDHMVMVAASRRGRSHEHAGTFRDDDFLLALEHGWDILAVADGAGSAKSSRKGSELAVYKSVEYLKNALSIQSEKIEQEAAIWFASKGGQVKTALYETFGRAAFAAFKAIEEEAASKNANPKEYSTTLLLAGHKKLPIGHFFAAYWVGDGGVGVYEKGKKLQLLGEVDSGEFAGQTRFLDKQVMTPDDVMQRLRFTITDDFTGLVLMTDGVTDPKFETDNNLASLQKWDELWTELEPMLLNKASVSDDLLKWLEFWSPGNHDDRTIALLYK